MPDRPAAPAPWLEDPDVTLYHGDCLEVLRELPAGSVHMCATSPPFYGLRDYGTEGQIGLEETPDQWVARLVAVFREVRRVLRDDGTLWVEVGDSYYAAGWESRRRSEVGSGSFAPEDRKSHTGRVDGLKVKDLIGGPWLLAFALRADGWFLRSEIIWARPNPMPESVRDRPTKSHSTVFLLSKAKSYFYDADAIREPHARLWDPGAANGSINNRTREAKGIEPNPAGANCRSVWNVATEPTPFAHFATWPQALVRRMILAGCPEGGIVLDPFAGSGTTSLVARNHGRHSIGIELNEEYLRIAARRLQQLSLLADA